MENFATTQRDSIKKFNENRILNILWKEGKISRTGISKILKLRPATVNILLNKLMKEGFIRETGFCDSNRGRKAKAMELNRRARVCIGICLGDSNILSVLTDLHGNIIKKVDRGEKIFHSKKDLLKKIFYSIDNLIKNPAVKKDKILGIGIGIPGLVDQENGISHIYRYYQWWTEIPIKEIIESKYGIPTYIENDTRVLTLGEKWFGLGKNINNFLYLEVGEGIGLGLILNGHLYSGFSGSAGEFGHTIVKEAGPLCTCGNRGCLQAIASTTAIEKRVRTLIEQGVISNISSSNTSDVTFLDIVNAAKEGDKLAIEVLQDVFGFLGISLSNLINLFNPQMIIIGGLITRAGDMLLEAVKRVIRVKALAEPRDVVNIYLSQSGDETGPVSATTLVLRNIFETP